MNAIKYYDYAANLQKKNNAIHEKNMIKKSLFCMKNDEWTL